MKFSILMGSPKPDGNTAQLLKPFMAELAAGGCEVEHIALAEKRIEPCRGCRACQHVEGEYGCAVEDDTLEIMDAILESDCVVLATPIYTWFCTAPMKALLDRHYGLNKFYGSAARASLWEGKKVAIIATHGYKGGYATEPFETGVQRLCKHSGLDYLGLYSVRDKGDPAAFTSSDAIEGAKEFARRLMAEN